MARAMTLANRLVERFTTAAADWSLRRRMEDLALDSPARRLPPAGERPVLVSPVEHALSPSRRMQSVVTLSQTWGDGQGIVYGPQLEPRYDVARGCYLLSRTWYRNQALFPGVRLAHWPAPAWACSTMVNAVLGWWLNAGVQFREEGGAQIQTALTRRSKRGGYAEYVSPAWDDQVVTWRDVLRRASELPLVSVALIHYRKNGKLRSYASHVVLLLRCGRGYLELVDPNTGRPAEGLLRFAADGSFRDVPSAAAVKAREPGARREYSGKRTTFRPVEAGDSGQPRVWRVMDLLPHGRVPLVPGGVYHSAAPLLLMIES